ncbi:hypothetical protein H4R20_003343, partial [Coemansia guatemalensis]
DISYSIITNMYTNNNTIISAHGNGERVLPVKVAVRVRPMVVVDNGKSAWAATSRLRSQVTSCVEVLSDTSIRISSAAAGWSNGPASIGGGQNIANGVATGPRTFNFDNAFGPEASQADVYDTAIAPLLTRFVEGYNVTVLAYGQTSSGKTYTMGTGANMTDAPIESIGIVPRALQSLFAWAREGDHGAGLRHGLDIRASFIEVHNETLIDLIAPPQAGSAGSSIVVREDARGNIQWTGAREAAVASAEEAMAILADGSRVRQTSATHMNANSSRSHAIYTVTLTLTQTRARGSNGDRHAESVRVVSKLHFVDLAGSERLDMTQAMGKRQRKGISINSGLLALGNVISALSNACHGASAHVLYRDSKLTNMLRNSLGGSAQTLMIACISAVEANAAETANTLKYASHARAITNHGGVHMESAGHTSTEEVESLRATVLRLKGEVRMLSERLEAGEGQQSCSKATSATPLRIRPASWHIGDGMPTRIPTCIPVDDAAQKQRHAQAVEKLCAAKAHIQELAAKLEDANLRAEAQLKASADELRLKLQLMDEDWGKRWVATELDHSTETDGLNEHIKQLKEELRSSFKFAGETRDEHRTVTDRLNARIEQLEGELQKSTCNAEYLALELHNNSRSVEKTEIEHRAETDRLNARVKQLEGELHNSSRSAEKTRVEHRAETVLLNARIEQLEGELQQSTINAEHLTSELRNSSRSAEETEAKHRAETDCLNARVEQLEGDLHNSTSTAEHLALELRNSSRSAEKAEIEHQAETDRLNACIEQLKGKLRNSTCNAERLAIELHNNSMSAEETEAELRASRSQALDAEARAIRAEEALAALTARIAAKPEPETVVVPNIEEHLDQLQSATPAPDCGANGSLLAVCDQDACLQDNAEDLRGQNANLKEMVRDLCARLVGQAEEHDALEAKFSDRDALVDDVAFLSKAIEDMCAQMQQLRESKEEQRRVMESKLAQARSETDALTKAFKDTRALLLDKSLDRNIHMGSLQGTRKKQPGIFDKYDPHYRFFFF